MHFSVLDFVLKEIGTLPYLAKYLFYTPSYFCSTLRLFLRTVGVICWNKLRGCRQHKDKKNSPIKINNYLLKRIGLTIIYPMYLEKLLLNYPDTKVFIVPTAYSFLAVIES